jgi:hypothetical protein
MKALTLFFGKRNFVKQLLAVNGLDFHKHPVYVGSAFILSDSERLSALG